MTREERTDILWDDMQIWRDQTIFDDDDERQKEAKKLNKRLTYSVLYYVDYEWEYPNEFILLADRINKIAMNKK